MTLLAVYSLVGPTEPSPDDDLVLIVTRSAEWRG